MMNHDRVMLLIDGDNISSIAVIEQAILWIGKHYGGPHVRRVHCTPEWALSHRDALARLSIRAMVNLSSGKNSTDIALAADAMDLAIAERPGVFVIGSSDSDFTPLVARLREKGCKVVGLGQEGKTSRAAAAVYDDFELFPASQSRKPAAPDKTTPAKKAPTAKKAAPAKKAPAKKAVPVLAPPADKSRALLDALPELVRGDELDLNIVAQRLREHKLLSKSGSSVKLLGQFPQRFELTPSAKPNKVRLRR